jgi:transcription factor C subunit 7
LKTLDPPIQRFYSSPFYRCLQTINPAVEAVSSLTSDGETHKIRGENGIGEWYGMARFTHPSPAEPKLLNSLFERYDVNYKPAIKPSENGETIEELHDRTAYALHKIIEQADNEGVKAICICTHAATMQLPTSEWSGPETKIPTISWKGGNGVGGGWEVKLNGDCSFLSGGEERGW